MIIECEGCRSKFNLAESLLKVDGSKVRCSVCKKVFIAYPPEPEFTDAKDSGQLDLEETVALDSPPILAEREKPSPRGGGDADFDETFQKALDEEPTADLSVDGLADGAKPELLDTAGLYGSGEELAEADLDGDLTLDEEEAPAAAPPPKKRKSFRVMPVILVLILILLGGSAAVYLFAPEMLPESLRFLKPPQKGEVTDIGVARLSFSNVKGGFVTSDKSGQLFVIQGVVTNNYPKGRSFILVKGSLLDDKGQVVRTKMAYAGNVFPEERLKTMTLEEINQEMKNRAGSQNANTGIKPEGQVPFCIVIENLPENLSEFTVEAVSSSPEQP